MLARASEAAMAGGISSVAVWDVVGSNAGSERKTVAKWIGLDSTAWAEALRGRRDLGFALGQSTFWTDWV